MKRFIAAFLLLSACADDPTAPPGVPIQGPPEAPNRERPADHNPPQLFTASLAVAGTPTAGADIGVSVSVAALFPIDAVVTLRAPEIRAAELRGTGLMYAPLDDPDQTVVARWPIRAGTSPSTLHHTINIPAAGTYQLVVTIEPAFEQPVGVMTATHARAWIDAQSGTGRVVREQPLPRDSNMLPGPGPVRTRSALIELAALGTPRTPTDTCWIDGIPCEVYPEVSLYDVDYGTYVPLANVRVNLRYLDQDPYDGHTIVVADEEVYTDARGRYQVNCRYHSYVTEGVIVTGSFETANSSVAIYQGDGNYPYRRSFNHGDLWEFCRAVAHDERYFWIGVAADEFQVFRNFVTVINNSRASMGYSRGWLKVKTRPGSDASNYSDFWDDVEIYSEDIWHDWGRFTAAHEYGHALHEEGLGGNVASGACPKPHYINVASNEQCAFSEGFADFHGVFTMPAPQYPTSGTTLYRAESRWDDYSGGISTEGKVAAFYLDLADGSGSPDQISGDDDPAAYGGRYIGDAIRNCVITWREDVSQINEDEVVQQYNERSWSAGTIIHCLMAQITPLGQMTRGGLDSQRNIITYRAVSATSINNAPGWSRTSVSAIWQNNISDNDDAPVPPPPPPPTCVEGPQGAECQPPTVAKIGQ